MKIGIYGGAFNPPHQGHIEVAELASQYLDEVWIMPCYKHNYGKNMLNGHHRLNMCNLTFNHNKIKVSNFEIENNISGGTYVLANILKNKYNHSFYFIIGQDNANEIHKWLNYNKLINEFPFIVIMRYLDDSNDLWYKKDPHIYIKTKITNISSTEIRNNIQDNIKPNHINNSVFKYIEDNNLY